MGYYGWETVDFDEERDTKTYGVWLFDAKDSFPVEKPFDLWRQFLNDQLGMQYCAEMLSIPGNKGWAWRLKGPCHYFSVIETTEAERREREPIYREKIRPWVEDFEKEWRGRVVPFIMNHFEQMRKVDLEKLSDIGLREYFEEFQYVSHRVWKDGHWVPFYAVFNIYLDFDNLCQELLGINDTHPQFKALMSGFENRTYQSDRELWRMASLARELDLERIFWEIPNDEKLLSHFKQMGGNGQKWLKEFNEMLWEEGWRCPGHVSQVSNPSWVEQPSLALPSIRHWLLKGGEFSLDKERERLAKEREKTEKDILPRVPSDKRDRFLKLLRAAQWQGRWNEEHQFYCENYWNALGRRVTKEIGKRFAESGTVKELEDIYFLLPEEITMRLIGRERFDAHKLVGIRKKQYEEYVRAEPPQPVIGDPNEIPRLAKVDPVVRVLLVQPIVKPKLKADLYGSASAPGVIEGTARVIMDEMEFSQVKPGELLVSVTSNPMWTPLFGIVKGVVVDFGGSLSHAVIVGREYGLPVVAGTLEGTKKIKTGDRIRIDGDEGAVYILNR